MANLQLAQGPFGRHSGTLLLDNIEKEKSCGAASFSNIWAAKESSDTVIRENRIEA
jgi:hypothetical protein